MKKILFSLACGLMVLSGCCNKAADKQAAGDGCCGVSKDSMQIVMNIPMKIKPESLSAYLAAFKKCQEGTLQEPGAIEYAMFRSLTDSTELFLFERWKDKPSHKAHMETTHFKQYREETAGMNDTTFQKKTVVTYVCPAVNN